MKLFTKLAVVVALSSIALQASALQPIADTELSKVAGQDGVSIAADLHINIGEFKYTNTATNGGSVSFKDIGITGTIAATLDVINEATFKGSVFSTDVGGLGVNLPTGAGDPQAAALGAFYAGGDVVKIAVPKIAVASAHGLNMAVGSISMGNSAATFGSIALNDIKLQGTSVYIWAH